jgi:polysaccharide export outer membrane protein
MHHTRTAAALGLLALVVLQIDGRAAQAPVEPAVPGLAGQEGGRAPLYVIQRGDELSIRVFGRPELDDTVRVRPDGRVSAPLVDDVEAAGLTVPQLDVLVTERYGRFFRDPEVSIILRAAANQRVFVGGEVAQPGVIDMTGTLTVIGAVYQAGGFRRSARTDSVVLLRDTNALQPFAMSLNLKDAAPDSAVVLRPYDVVYVPESRIAKVDNFVDQYVRQLIPISLTAGFSYVLGNQVFVTK